MSENNQSKENQNRQFDEDQYKMLIRCSEKKDITEWNEWWKDNKEVDILLEGADLSHTHLKDGDLSGAYLKGANLSWANLERALLPEAHLEGADLSYAHLEYTFLSDAHLESAILSQAHLEGNYLWRIHLEGADLRHAYMKEVDFSDAHLEGANLSRVHLEGADLSQAHLEDSIFLNAILDNKTLLWDCTINEETDFTGTGLDSARVEPRLKVALQGNIRRKQWQEWYKEGSKFKQQYKKLIVKPFWWVSDYGRSTSRIIGCFFVMSIMFALFYYLFGLMDGQGIVANLFTVDQSFGEYVVPVPISSHIIPIRAIYFSIVTMTTLGFGDMYAQANSYLGHILLTIQVLLGYVLLGALVTRFAILFTSSGPEKK